VQHQAGDSLSDARRVLECDRRTQADATDIVIRKPEAIGERPQEFRVARYGEGRLASRRFAAPGQVWNQDAPMATERRTPAVEVLQGADEAVTQKQRVARPLVEVPDPPLPDVDVLDVLRADRGFYSPVSIWARCSRPL
jgi:hypothetical protein